MLHPVKLKNKQAIQIFLLYPAQLKKKSTENQSINAKQQFPNQACKKNNKKPNKETGTTVIAQHLPSYKFAFRWPGI
jgi:hypothetical protein